MSAGKPRHRVVVRGRPANPVSTGWTPPPKREPTAEQAKMAAARERGTAARRGRHDTTEPPPCVRCGKNSSRWRRRGLCEACYKIRDTAAFRWPLIAQLQAQGDWADDGLCMQTDPEAFFPEKGGSTREAKAMCALCPVTEQCLEYALANEERFGIWGGKSERERRAILKDREAAAKAAKKGAA